MPEVMVGITLDLSYKNFYLNTFWQGATNTSVSFGAAMRYEFTPNVYSIHLGRWVYDEARGLDTRATATYPSLHFPSSPQTKTMKAKVPISDTGTVSMTFKMCGHTGS